MAHVAALAESPYIGSVAEQRDDAIYNAGEAAAREGKERKAPKFVMWGDRRLTLTSFSRTEWFRGYDAAKKLVIGEFEVTPGVMGKQAAVYYCGTYAGSIRLRMDGRFVAIPSPGYGGDILSRTNIGVFDAVKDAANALRDNAEKVSRESLFQ